MFETIYLEESVSHSSNASLLLSRFPQARVIPIRRYTEVFNRKAQNFRLQKKKPALILAEKFDNFVLKTPAHYGIGARHNYYFSHMMNCIYDCRYCFLQGMYRSAHYVLFINYDDFITSINNKIEAMNGEEIHFFSGYDCDSLAFEPVSRFTEHFLPLFKQHPNALVELRTKSTQIRTLLDSKAFPNCVVAYSLTPEKVAAALEHKAASLEARISAMQRLQKQGWQIGLRFDPLIYQSDFRDSYGQLFKQVFASLDPALIHSVSLGSFRLPRQFFKTLSRMYPDEKLFASPLEDDQGMISYKKSLHKELLTFVHTALLEYIESEKLFICET